MRDGAIPHVVPPRCSIHCERSTTMSTTWRDARAAVCDTLSERPTRALRIAFRACYAAHTTHNNQHPAQYAKGRDSTHGRHISRAAARGRGGRHGLAQTAIGKNLLRAVARRHDVARSSKSLRRNRKRLEILLPFRQPEHKAHSPSRSKNAI